MEPRNIMEPSTYPIANHVYQAMNITSYGPNGNCDTLKLEECSDLVFVLAVADGFAMVRRVGFYNEDPYIVHSDKLKYLDLDSNADVDDMTVLESQTCVLTDHVSDDDLNKDNSKFSWWVPAGLMNKNNESSTSSPTPNKTMSVGKNWGKNV